MFPVRCLVSEYTMAVVQAAVQLCHPAMKEIVQAAVQLCHLVMKEIVWAEVLLCHPVTE